MAIAGLFGTGNAATPLANRNYIVDGACEYVIGGSSSLTAGFGYTANVMYLGAAGTGGAATVANSTLRNQPNSAFDTGPNSYYSHTQTTASTGSFATGDLPAVGQRIEFVNKLAGKSVTLSAKLWVASGSITVPGIVCSQNMGTGGSPSAGVSLSKAVNWNVTTSPKKFSVRLDLPSVVGNTFGTNNNDFTVFGIFFPAGWTGTIAMTELQVELCSPRSSSDINGNGGAPTAFEYRGWQAEYARIQRYFETGTEPDFYQATGNSGISAAYGDVRFAVAKRSSPAMTFSGWIYYSAGLNTSFTPGIHSAPTDKFSFTGTSLTNWNGWYPGGTWFADARL